VLKNPPQRQAANRKLKIGAMLYLEAPYDIWSINSELLYMNLEQEISPSTLINSGKVNAKQLGWELAGLKRVTPGSNLVLGAS